jgi:hypothetical protein
MEGYLGSYNFQTKMKLLTFSLIDWCPVNWLAYARLLKPNNPFSHGKRNLKLKPIRIVLWTTKGNLTLEVI